MKMSPLTTGLSLLLALWAVPALAAPSSDLGVGQKRPWAQGVSETNQAMAAAYFEQGNALLENALLQKAIERYEQALELWSHPSIHYNLALALVNLNEPLKLHQHLMEALRYEGQPLDAAKINRIRDLLQVVERQLVRVKITCDVPGATVRLDGTDLFVAPGQYEAFLLPDEYTFTIVKKGYPPNERKRTGSAGEVLVLDYRLYTQAEMTRYHRPWPVWRPWAVVGAGVVLSGSGLLFHNRATERYRAFDEAVLRCSSANNDRGCLPGPELLTEKARGNTLQRASLGTFSVGGAALALGLTLVYFNQLQADVISPDEHEQSLTVAPMVGGAWNGVTATFSF
jgi:tetratricopeptide (TPR) repeat protein